MWLDPGVHWTLHGAEHALPSTVSDNPAGALVTVTLIAEAVKFAVSVAGAFIVRFCGVVVPLNAPENPVN